MNTDTYVTIGIDLVSVPPIPACPKVRAHVDGAKVTWRKRDSTNRYYARTGWLCGECSAPDCWHVEEVEEVLSAAVISRLRAVERRSA